MLDTVWASLFPFLDSFRKTGLEDTYGVNINCINNRKPEVMGLRKILKLYTDFKTDIYNKKYTKLLAEQQDVKEIKEGLLEAVDVIDLIIEILRGSKTIAMAKKCLMTGETEGIKFRFKGSEMDAKELRFTEKQTDAILAMRLSKLIGLEIEALKKELAEAERLIKKYTKLLGSKAEMRRQMIADMEELKKFAKPRMTVIQDLGEIKVKKAEEKPVEISVLLDRFYYLKCIDRNIYDKNVEQIQKDYRFSVNTMTDDRLIAFTDKGFAYVIKISDLVKKQAKKQSGGKGSSIFGKLSDKGIQIFEFCEMESDENVIFIDALSCIIKSNLVFVTDNGRAKRTEGAQFDVTRKKVAAVKVGDVPVMVKPAEENDFVAARSEKGFFVRVKVGDISIQGKGAGGVKLIKLADDDKLTEAEVGATTDASIGEVSFSRIKLCKPGNKGTKLRV